MTRRSAATYLDLTLERDGWDIKRTFSASYRATIYGRALNDLAEDRDWIPDLPHKSKIIEALKRRHAELTSTQDVPGYLDAIGAAVLKAGSKSSTFRIKVCRDHLFLEVREDGKPATLPFFHAVKESVRGLADTLLLLAPTLQALQKDRDKKNKIAQLLQWYELTVVARRISGGRDKATFRLLPRIEGPSSAPHENRRLICGAQTFLLASANVRSALANLARAWHDPMAYATLVCAAAGSGKDVLKDMLVYALAEYELRSTAGPTLSASSTRLQSLQSLLTAKKSANNVKKLGREQRHSPAKILLFVDEIHHRSSRAARELLLQPLTAHQLDLGTGRPIDLSNVRYLFAASRPRSEIRNEKPVDFWTRMNHTIEMKHPLALPRAQRQEVLTDYFRFFWARRADTVRKRTAADPAAKRLCDEGIVRPFCLAFGNDFNSPLAGLISIRTIDAIVGQLYSRALYELRSDPGISVDTLAAKGEEWMPEICELVVNESERAAMF